MGRRQVIAMQWTDADGVVHACDSCMAAPDIRLVWTLCGIDVPPNGARRATDVHAVSCEDCFGFFDKGLLE